jgi:hypothetical protein
MDVAIIAPKQMLEVCTLGGDRFHMVLPAGMDDQDYVRFYRDCEGYKVLDNGIVEGDQIDGYVLHHMANDVGASCIVVPDTYRDASATIKQARKFEACINPELDYMGVLQGYDLSDVIKCLYFYDSTPWITPIGLPRILCELHKLQRVTLVEKFREMQVSGDISPALKWHALGASPWITEVAALAEAGCDSMDTSLPVVHGLAGVSLTHDYIKRPDGFMNANLDRSSLVWRTCIQNVKRYLELSGTLDS